MSPLPTACIIAVANQKGGVGKTTCTLNLGAALVEKGYRVLLVDMDPQAHLTLGLGVDPASLERSLAQVLTNSGVTLADVILTISETSEKVPGRLALVPASIDLATAELELTNALGRDQMLSEVLAGGDPAAGGATADMRREYDFIVIDTPPTLGLLTINSLVAARWALIPVQAHFYALKGMTHLLKLVRQVRGRLNKQLGVIGILTTFYDGRTQLARQVLESLQEEYPELVFKTVIKTTVKLAEAPITGESILSSAGSSEAAKSYRELAEEVLQRQSRK
jgi:chromosome partitioning protein